MAYGDHIYVNRNLLYSHHGIDCGDGKVIHFDPKDGGKWRASVRETTKEAFAPNGTIRIVSYRRCEAPGTVVEQARSCLGMRQYNWIFNNCEHFATWCKTGNHESTQVAMGIASGVQTVRYTWGIVQATRTMATAGGVASGPLAIVGGVLIQAILPSLGLWSLGRLAHCYWGQQDKRE